MVKDIEAQKRGNQLLHNPDVLEMFKWKYTMLHSIREFLFLNGAIEVDVPYMNRYREGAPLEQFETTNPVSRERYFLRHSPENYLRRVGRAFGNVYEIGKNFRVEGSEDKFRANEYLVLEQMTTDYSYSDGIRMVHDLIQYAVKSTFGALNTGYIDFSDIKIVSFDDLMKDYLGFSMFDSDAHNLCLSVLGRYELPLSEEKYDWEIYELISSHIIEPKLVNPTIIVDYPIPLQHTAVIDKAKGTAQRFSIVVNGIEICDGGIKFSDAEEYRAVYEENADYAIRYMGFKELDFDPDFYEDIAGDVIAPFSYGIGIERLFALCVGKNIHDVILFPFR